MAWVGVIIQALMVILKSVFGTDKPAKTTVVHLEPEVGITDGKTDKERLSDLGL